MVVYMYMDFEVDIGSKYVVEEDFFFFKQKTAYEMLRSLVGSEMCIRDSDSTETCSHVSSRPECSCTGGLSWGLSAFASDTHPVSYTHLTLPTIYSV